MVFGFIKKLFEPAKVDVTEPEYQIKNLDVEYYDFSNSLDDDFIDSIKRTKEVEYEKFVKSSNSKLLSDHYIVFDFETTGLDAEFEDIIEIGAIKFEYDHPIQAFKTYIKPTKKIRKKITDITGITNDDVANAPTIEEIMPHFINFIGNYTLVAHNAKFDMSFLLDKLYKLGYSKPKNKVIDTLTLSRKYIKDIDDKKLKSYSLESLKEELGLWEIESHAALEDCKACALVLLECKKEIEYENIYSSI